MQLVELDRNYKNIVYHIYVVYTAHILPLFPHISSLLGGLMVTESYNKMMGLNNRKKFCIQIDLLLKKKEFNTTQL